MSDELFVEADPRLCAGVERAVGDGSGTHRSQADKIIAVVEHMAASLIHDSAKVPYAVIPQPNSVRVVHPLKSTAFASLIASEFHRHYGKAPSSTAVSAARLVLEGQALHEGRSEEVCLRVAQSDDAIDLDLGDDRWRMVHVTPEGWTIEPHGSRLFRRSPGMIALPEPVRGDKPSLDEFRSFLRVDEEGFALILSFVLCAMRGRGPYPILQIGGEHGSAKTTTARILRGLIDPNKVDVRAHCSDTRDLLIAATHGHLLIFDNLSSISARVSDDLCRLATGGGFTTRALYTDQDEVIFEAQRPVIITGIPDLADRADLRDRCLPVRLATIAEHERQTEGELWKRFRAAQPRMLGVLLDALSVGLRTSEEVRKGTRRRPRMADAYIWSLSTAPSLGVPRDVLSKAWRNTRDEANALILESSAIYEPLRQVVEPLLAHGATWCGTATELHKAISELADEATRRRRDWPQTATALGKQLPAIAPALRAVGIDHSYDKGAKRRLHSFRTALNENESESSVITVTPVISRFMSGDSSEGSRTDLPADRHAPVTREVLIQQQNDAGDSNDSKAPALSRVMTLFREGAPTEDL